MSSKRRKINEESELEEIRKGFEMFDVNGTGKIIPVEVKEAMDSMNMKEKNPFIYEIIESLSLEKKYMNNGGMSIEDLVNYVYEKVNDNETNYGLRQLFDALKDPDSDTISMHTFIKLAKDYGDEDGLSEEELRYLLEKTQLGGDELTFDEFYTIMKGGGSSSSKSNASLRSSNANNININKKQSPLSNVASSQENYTYKKEEDNFIDNDNNNNNFNANNNINNEKELVYIDNMKSSPEKSISVAKNESNTNINEIELEASEKGVNEVRVNPPKSQEISDKKDDLESNTNINIEIEKKEIKTKDENNNNVIVEKKEIVVKMEQKEEKPVRKYKYNRFRRTDSNSTNSNNENNKENKNTVEEKTTVVKSVYRTRRPINLSNNEDKKSGPEKEKSEGEMPRRYHRRYRENKISTNIDH